jgi:hypothetical protein
LSELEGIDGDLPAKLDIEEEQDRKIAKMSGKPRGPIKSVTRANRREAAPSRGMLSECRSLCAITRSIRLSKP